MDELSGGGGGLLDINVLEKVEVNSTSTELFS